MLAELQQQLSTALKGRYDIQHELGRSRTSTVFLAQDTKHNRPVALKVLSPSRTDSLESEAFFQEIETTAHLNHPHVLTLLDSGQADGLLYFVTPYIKGESLRDRLMWEKQLPVEDAVQICREVADALACAHSHGMVHRDIKPENILLSDGHATVSDFGLARAITAGCDEFAPNGEPGMAVGTPAYMSPEQAAGDADVDGRSDIYSLGCVLYEMLSGRPPFSASTADELLKQQVHAEPAPIVDYRPQLPPDIIRAIDRALSKAPADRFSKASDLVAALPFPSDIRRAAEAARNQAQPFSEFMRWFTSPRTSLRTILVGLAIAAIAVWSVAESRSSLDPGASSSTAVSRPLEAQAVAVLPFINMSSDSENEVFADGVHEDILTQLGQVRGLKVVSRTSVMPYRRSAKSIEQIGQELRVGTILEGSVRRLGDQVRITAQAIDANSDTHIWAATYDRQLTDDNVFSVQSDIAREITEALQEALLDSASPGITTLRPSVWPSPHASFSIARPLVGASTRFAAR